MREIISYNIYKYGGLCFEFKHLEDARKEYKKLIKAHSMSHIHLAAIYMDSETLEEYNP